MKIFGIEFAPLNVALRRRLQTLSVVYVFVTIGFADFIAWSLWLYLLFTSLRWLMVLYVLWIFLIDKDICKKGGRRWEWVRSWTCLKYFKEYFPIKLEKVPSAQLDKSKNYLFCTFPHGIIGSGVFSTFVTNYGEFNDFFPHHTPYQASLDQHFLSPFHREIALAVGMVSARKESLKWLLNSPDGGKAVSLVPGGAEEAYYSRPGQYKIIVKKRKGFVKLAMETGSPIVPVILFGEPELYDQPNYDQYPTLHKIQEIIRKLVGTAPVIPLGRGIFQYSFGLLPHRKPVTVLIGEPLDIERVENPDKQQVDEIHEKFVNYLKKLFEEQKHKYIKDADKAFVEII